MKNEFEMNDLEKPKFCLGLKIEHFPERLFVYQSIYTEKDLRHFYMNNAHPLALPRPCLSPILEEKNEFLNNVLMKNV